MQEERRKTVRREADRELLKKAHLAAAGADDRQGPDAQKAAERLRRRAIRHNCKVGIQMVIGHASGYSDDWSVDSVKIGGRVLDLSAGGASLFTKQSFETGQQLRLIVQLRDGSKIGTNGTVRWVKEVPQRHGYASGVEFGEVPGKDRKKIAKFLTELDHTSGL